MPEAICLSLASSPPFLISPILSKQPCTKDAKVSTDGESRVFTWKGVPDGLLQQVNEWACKPNKFSTTDSLLETQSDLCHLDHDAGSGQNHLSIKLRVSQALRTELRTTFCW